MLASASRSLMREHKIWKIARSLAQPVTYMGLAMLVFIFAAVAYLFAGDRKGDYSSALSRGENVVQIFAQSYSHVVTSVDSTLSFLRKSYLLNPSGFRLADWVDMSSIRNNNLVLDFTIFDASGRVIDTTFANTIIGHDRSHLPCFRTHLSAKADNLFIGSPYQLTTSQRWAIPLSRKITGTDGSFIGVIVAFIDPFELGRRVANVDLGKNGAFALVGFDGVMYMRVVEGKVASAAIGEKLAPQTPILRHLGPGKSGHYWNAPQNIDGISRLISYRAIDPFPLTAIVGVSEAEVYRHSNESERIYLAIVALLTIAIAIAMYFGAVRQQKLLDATAEMVRAKDLLAETNQELERRVSERTNALAEEIRQREKAQMKLADVNRDLEIRFAERTTELSNEMGRREQAQMIVARMQKMEAVGQLTAGIAHDFNNLLAVIKGSLQFVEEAAMRGLPTKPELIDAGLRATRRGAELVRRLLAFSRQSPRKTELTMVDQLVLDTLRLLQRTLGEKIEIMTNLRATDAAVTVDRNQLANALVNLAVNARDAMPDGGQLAIETECRVVEGTAQTPLREEVWIIIGDTGAGMTDEVRERAFEPFFTTKPDGLGSGLGLSMVHGFVEQSSGQIEIDSSGHGFYGHALRIAAV